MPNNDDPGGNADNTNKNNNPAKRKVVWAIVAGGVVGVLVILFVSLFFPNLTERPKFFTTNALSVLVLDVIIVQAYIYTKQWEVLKEQSSTLKTHSVAMAKQITAMEAQLTAMQDQAESMRDSLTETRNLVIQNERSVKAAEEGVSVARQNMNYAQRAYVTVTDGVVTLGVGGTDRFRMRVENSGNTPAYSVQVEAEIEVREHGVRITPGGDPIVFI